MLREKFEEIRDTEIPKLTKSWKCTKFCHFGRTTFENTSLLPIIEKRENQVTPVGEYQTKCEQIRYCLGHRSPESIMKHCSKPDFKIDYYHAPGSVEEEKQEDKE